METESLPPFSIEPTDSASTRWERWLRRFDNFVMARDIATDARQKAMLLHYAGEAVFDLSEAVGVIPTDNFDATKLKLTAYFTPWRNEEYEVFTFRQTQQKSGETIDQFHARLQQMCKKCNFEDKNHEIKSQIIQKCLMHKIRDKGLSKVNITLPQLLTYGQTLEATVQQAKIRSNAASNDTSVHAVSHVAQSFSSKQGENGAPHFRTTRGRGRSSSHRDHQVAGPIYDKPHYKPHQGINHRIGWVPNRVLGVGDNHTTGWHAKRGVRHATNVTKIITLLACADQRKRISLKMTRTICVRTHIRWACTTLPAPLLSNRMCVQWVWPEK